MSRRAPSPAVTVRPRNGSSGEVKLPVSGLLPGRPGTSRSDRLTVHETWR